LSLTAAGFAQSALRSAELAGTSGRFLQRLFDQSFCS
jgi:hypothetical protein